MIIRFLLRHTLPRRIAGFALFALCVLLAALLLPVATLVSRRAGRFAAFARSYLAVEATGLWQLARLRRAGPEAHYELLHRSLGRLYRTACRHFDLQIAPPSPAPLLPRGPMILAARHAGPGDSFLLVYGLLAVSGHHPRVVLSRLLTMDPFIDILLRRTPNCFVGLEPDQRRRVPDRIATIAGTLGPDDALVIFPEGCKFTTARRSRLIERLRARRAKLLPTARKLEHVLPPHSSGLFAAIDAAPAGTQVAFLAHTGLDWIESVRDAWVAVPLTTPVEATWWTVPVEAIPAEEAQREQWLREQWLRMDAWIERNAPAPEDADAGSLSTNRQQAITASGDSTA